MMEGLESVKATLENEEQRDDDIVRKLKEAQESLEELRKKRDEIMKNREYVLQRGSESGHEEYQELLIQCIVQHLSFQRNRPITAISLAIESQEKDINTLSYWLFNASTLLLRDGATDTLRQVEAKYPALRFKQQLIAYVEKIYVMIRDNLKKEISPLLGLCIQAPRTWRASIVKGTSRSAGNTTAHWQGIVKSLTNFLNTLKSNKVPSFLVRKVFTQIFSFINVQLFNSLLLRRECCSFSNGEYVKAGLSELEHWCYKATDEYVGSSWNELKHIREAIGFLVIQEKPKKSLDEISHDLCPVLSIQQLYRISTMYWDDKYGTHSVSPDVIANMRVLMTEDSNNAVSNSFLLDDDSSIPFSVDDLSKSIERFDIADIEPPPLIRENSGFSFLLPLTDYTKWAVELGDDKPQKSLNEKQQELLSRCILQHLGFQGNRPIAACIIYKCLLQWRSFEDEQISVFNRIIQTIGHAIELNQEKNNNTLAYWLSNVSTLLLLLQGTLKASTVAEMAPQLRRSSSVPSFGRMTQSFHGEAQGAIRNGATNTLMKVEARYPALVFKQLLTAYVEKIYGMIRDNLREEISPLLGLCIQAAKTSRASLVGNTAAHWQGIVKSLTNFLTTLKSNNVPSFLVRKVFTQIFSFINVQLFNSLLLRRECCSLSNGEYLKADLSELEHWCYKATDEYAGSSWDELKHIRQAVGFLVIHQKQAITLDEISHDLCPVLSIQQLYRISTMYWDDKSPLSNMYKPGHLRISPTPRDGLAEDVIAKMRVRMTEDSNNSVSNSFLLDVDSSIPFSADDLSKSMESFDIADIELPPLIRENSGFNFLLPVTE